MKSNLSNLEQNIVKTKCNRQNNWTLPKFVLLSNLLFMNIPVYSSTGKYLDCFQGFAIMNNAAVNYCIWKTLKK